MGGTNVQLPIGQQVSLPGHWDLPVTLASARPLGKGIECRVRLPDGTLDEAVINQEEGAALAGPALKGGELADISADAEQSALGKLLANWSAVMEGQHVKADRQKGQERFV